MQYSTVQHSAVLYVRTYVNVIKSLYQLLGFIPMSFQTNYCCGDPQYVCTHVYGLHTHIQHIHT